MKSGATGFKRVWNATKYSLHGIKAAWQNEAAFRQEVVLLVLFTVLAFWLPVEKVERILLIGSLVIVLIAELLNSAIEAIVDRVGSGFHELSGRAKDIGSAAVFLSLCLAGFVWIYILFF